MGSGVNTIPSEFAIGEVYFPPELFVGLLAIVLAILTSRLLNHFRLSRFFFFPPAVFVAFVVIYAGLISYAGIFGSVYSR